MLGIRSIYLIYEELIQNREKKNPTFSSWVKYIDRQFTKKRNPNKQKHFLENHESNIITMKQIRWN